MNLFLCNTMSAQSDEIRNLYYVLENKEAENLVCHDYNVEQLNKMTYYSMFHQIIE